MFHVTEVDYTTAAGAKKSGILQPALAVSEGAPNEKPVIQEMNEGTIAPRFEKRNVLNAHDPTFDVVIQQNEIVTTEYRRLAFLSLTAGVGRPSGSFWIVISSVRFFEIDTK